LGINYNGRLGIDKDYIQPEKVETLTLILLIDIIIGRNKQKKESMYPQSYPTNCRYLDVEKWEMYYSLEGEFTSQIHMIMAFDNGNFLLFLLLYLVLFFL